MTTRFKSYTSNGILSIDSDFRGYALVGIEKYTGTAGFPSWAIPCAADEILVLAESSHPTYVHSYRNGVMLVFTIADSDRLAGSVIHTANITIYRFSYKRPTKKGLFNVYTEDGDLAFTSAQPMLRPFRYLQYVEEGNAPPPGYAVRKSFTDVERFGVVLSPSFRYTESQDVGSYFGHSEDDWQEFYTYCGFIVSGKDLIVSSFWTQMQEWTIGGYKASMNTGVAPYNTNKILMVYL